MTQITILQEFEAERKRQDQQWGGPIHDDQHQPDEWVGMIHEQLDKAEAALLNDEGSETFRHHLRNAGTMCLAAMETLDRQLGGTEQLRVINVEMPFARGSDTSRAAASSMLESRKADLRRIYEYIVKRGIGGSICDEAEVALHLTHQTCSACFRNLEKDGFIEKTARKRPTRSTRLAVVYVAIEGKTLL